MKKLFIFLTMLVLGIVSSWADETYTIIDNDAGGAWSNGFYSNDNGNSNWKGSWVSKSMAPSIIVSANTYLLNKNNGYIGSSTSKIGTYTITIMGAYYIKGYEIKFKNVNTDGSHNQTITPKGESGVIAEGTNDATVSVSGLTNQTSTTFTVTGENTFAKITSFKIYYVAKESSEPYTWSSGVAASEINNNYSNVYYLQLKSPTYWDVFFDHFELSHRTTYNADDAETTYLAFTYNIFDNQDNHNANEFIAISTTSITGHGTTTVNTVNYEFADQVRLEGNTTVYACFVSRNDDGTYCLRKKGVGVKGTTTNGTLNIYKGDSYANKELTTKSDYQCHYTCNYTSSYSFPQSSESNYRIWSGMNYKDRKNGGWITVAYMKITAPGTSDNVVQFNQFSLSLRNSDVVANTYLLLSKECLTGTGVTTSTNFAPSRFTAISSNSVPSANYGKVFTFTFDSDQFLHGGQTYYIYMGTKNGDNFNLQKYGIFINHETSNSGFEYSSALETAASTKNDAWQAIYYSSRCSFVDPSSLLEGAYTYVNYYSGNSLGKYTSESYTPNQIATALSDAESVYSGSDVCEKFLSYLTLRDIKESLTNLNLPAGNTFLRIRGNSDKYVAANTATNVAQMSLSHDDATTIFYLTSDKKLISYSNGLGLYWTHAFAAPENASLLNTFTFSEGGSTGKYTIQSNASTVHERTVDEYFSDGGGESLGRAASVSSPSTDWQLTEVTSLPVTFNSAALGYATFNSPVALKVPKDVKAYVCRIDGETIRFYNANKFTDEEGNWILPKNTAVLLYNKDYLTDATKYFTITSTTDEYEDGENDFTGTVAAASPASGCTYYSLRKRSDGKAMGFYQRSSTAGSLAGFRAWIVDTTGKNARNFTVIFDGDSDPTGIVEALGLENDNVEIYDLNGRKLSSYQKGINIINGKKIFK